MYAIYMCVCIRLHLFVFVHVFVFVSYVYVPFVSVDVHVHPSRVVFIVEFDGHVVHVDEPAGEYDIDGHGKHWLFLI